jgi:transposase
MRFVPVKDVAQQSVLMLHRARTLLVRQRTMLVNALRANLAGFAVLRHGRNRATKDAEWVRPRREREDCFLLRDGDAVKCCLRGRCFSPRQRLDVAPFHSWLQFSLRACLARCEKETDVW